MASRAAEEIRKAIEEENSRLERLCAETERSRRAIAVLQSELRSVDARVAPRASLPLFADAAPTTGAEKVRLFRRLFRGRDDVYPKLWTNAKKGTTGYAPACANEWIRDVCDKPRVKCGVCPNQEFLPVTDRVVLDHLRGHHVAGVYPILRDDTCWFLAADFDGPAWIDDVAAFADTCRRAGVPIAVERSRSGDGAHAWFFFAEPVPARIARSIGCHLLTETMSRRHTLGMASYDRLFPNQDMLPKGGFGNLIALPLQHAARARGNTVFLNDALVPFPDDQQWSYLASIRPIESSAANAVAREASRRGRVVAVQSTEGEPWKTPALESQRSGTLPSLPATVRAVLAQRLFVERTGLPEFALDAIRRIGAFQNPEFYKKQAMRLSTATTPRVISCTEEHDLHISLPRGCREELELFLREGKSHLEVDDQREDGTPLEMRFAGSLSIMQDAAARALLAHENGVLVAPPGMGKTVVGTFVVSVRARSTLILVHRRPLLEQWIAQLALFLGISKDEIGRIGGGKHGPNGRLDVAMIQTLVRNPKVDELVSHYGHVVIDECHHVPARSFENVLSRIRARFVTGLTATPQRRDGHHPITRMQIGPVRFTVDGKSQTAKHGFAHRLLVHETAFANPGSEVMGIQNLYAALATDEARNAAIIDDVIAALEEGRSPILLTERKDHLEFFETRLRSFARNMIVLRGGMGVKATRAAAERLAAIPANEERLILATGRFIGEGFDDARLDTLFLALPVSWKGTLVQYAGRLHRRHADKTEVRIHDYVDSRVPSLERMFQKRLRGYRSMGYERSAEPARMASPELTTVPDSEIWREES